MSRDKFHHGGWNKDLFGKELDNLQCDISSQVRRVFDLRGCYPRTLSIVDGTTRCGVDEQFTVQSGLAD